MFYAWISNAHIAYEYHPIKWSTYNTCFTTFKPLTDSYCNIGRYKIKVFAFFGWPIHKWKGRLLAKRGNLCHWTLSVGVLVIHLLQFSSLGTSSGYVGKFKLFDVQLLFLRATLLYYMALSFLLVCSFMLKISLF